MNLGLETRFDKSSRAYFSPTEFQKYFKFYCFCANMVQSVPSFITIGPKLCPGERVSYVNKLTDRHVQANIRVLGVTYESQKHAKTSVKLHKIVARLCHTSMNNPRSSIDQTYNGTSFIILFSLKHTHLQQW